MMAVAMAGFSMNDATTKYLTAEMNFGQVMLVRGSISIVLVFALAWYQQALRPITVLFKLNASISDLVQEMRDTDKLKYVRGERQ